jgi:23S rRNA (adenine2503-C2)-methyltransferase
MRNLKSLDIKKLGEEMVSLGEPSYRASQIFRWIWKRGEDNPLEFTDIPKKFREYLAKNYKISKLVEKRRRVSRDGSVKFLFELDDGLPVESVFIPDGKRKTVCVSSQVGCPLKCTFCATGLVDFKRNLEGWEIADQVLTVQKILKEKITNVVFMGMGEPLLNLREVKRAIEILTSHIGPNIGARRMTVSTAGIPEGIRELAEFKRQVKLAISLHTAVQEKREKIMPIAKKYTLSDLKEALIYFQKIKRRWITIEIVHLPGFNDGEEDIRELKYFLNGLGAKINLIPFNPFPNSLFRTPREEETEKFLEKLMQLPYTVTLRKSRGKDVKAACGQLAYFER